MSEMKFNTCYNEDAWQASTCPHAPRVSLFAEGRLGSWVTYKRETVRKGRWVQDICFASVPRGRGAVVGRQCDGCDTDSLSSNIFLRSGCDDRNFVNPGFAMSFLQSYDICDHCCTETCSLSKIYITCSRSYRNLCLC